MKRLTFPIAAIALASATPAAADEMFAVTPSGLPEAVFPRPAAQVVAHLANKCMDAAWRVVSTTTNQVVCEAPMSFGRSLLATLAMGNSYSTPPRQFWQFNLAEIAGVSRVQVASWTELQMAFGQTRRNDFSGATFNNTAMQLLTGWGGSFPVGTTFPNHATLGIEFADVPGRPNVARISEVDPNGAGAAAGLQPGDELTKIAGVRVSSVDRLLDGLAKAAESATFPIEFRRGGRLQTVTATRAYREPVTQGPTPEPVTETPMGKPKG